MCESKRLFQLLTNTSDRTSACKIFNKPQLFRSSFVHLHSPAVYIHKVNVISVAHSVTLSSFHVNPWIFILKMFCLQMVRRRVSWWDLHFSPDAFQKGLFYYASSSLVINKTKIPSGILCSWEYTKRRASAHLNKGKKCKRNVRTSLLIGQEPVWDSFPELYTNTFTATGWRIVFK